MIFIIEFVQHVTSFTKLPKRLKLFKNHEVHPFTNMKVDCFRAKII